MSDLPSTLINRFGIPGLAGGALAVLLIWIFAHTMSAPGTEVSIAWGLVTYTKAKATPTHTKDQIVSIPEPIPASKPKASSPAEDPVKPLETLTLAQNHYGSQPTKSALRISREQYNLRELLPLESGRPIRETPPGTYFFSLLAWFRSAGADVTADYLGYEAHRYSTEFKLEFQRSTKGELFMIGFVSDSDSARISTLTGVENTIVLKAQWHEQFKVQARIPVNRIRSSSPRTVNLTERQNIKVLDLVVF